MRGARVPLVRAKDDGGDEEVGNPKSYDVTWGSVHVRPLES